MYANLEEQYGLARHAMAVYDRACKTVAEEDRYTMYLLYISRATEFFGVTHTREIFTRGIESLPEKSVRSLSLKFADMERKLGEIDRARAIYTHGAQYCDPRVETAFWQVWSDFEKKHGNEETFREMLRIKRSVQAQYNTQINVMSAQMLAASKKDESEGAKKTANEMEALEKQAVAVLDKVPPPTVNAKQVERQIIEELTAANPEEIHIREPGEDEEDHDVELEQIQIPTAVFGSVNAGEVKDEEMEEEGQTGALARFKRKRQ